MKKRITVLSVIVIGFILLFLIQPMALVSAAPKNTPNPTKTPTPTPTPTMAPSPTLAPTPTSSTLSTCATSTPSSGTYSVTLCFTSPTNGASVTGAVTVGVSVSTTGTSPGVQRLIFYINGAYLLTDFQGPYSFSLPTAKWQDGTYGVQVQALMRDGYTTTQEAGVSLTFINGNQNPPVNTNTFTPSTGTIPQNGAPFIVAAAGDGADGASAAAGVASLITSINPNLFLYLGDVYENGSAAEFYNWYGNNGSNFSAFLGITDPTIGNHEYTGSSAAGYFDYWNNIPNYYSYNADGWHFVSLNSNSSRIGVDGSSAQYAWLQSDLAANAQACTVVYYHHPLFNIGAEGPTTSMSTMWSLMAQYGVTIVLNGHDHDYQRWVPLDGNGNPSPTGITEFVAGGAGHGLQNFITTDSRVAFSDDLNPEAFGVLKLELNTDGASFSYVNSSGTILDSGVVPCNKSGADTQPPTTPANLTATATGATQVDLNWQASSDNTGVSGYTIYRDGTVLATVSGTTLSYSDHTVLPSTTYSYTVDAFDPAGNHSPKSSPVSVTTPAMPTSLTFDVQEDTYVNSGSPSSNYGSATVWRVDASPVLNGYLQFNVQGLAGYAINKATLLVYTNTTSSIGIQAQAVADNSWTENNITYSNAPPIGAAIGSSLAYTAGTWVPIDVTPYVTGEGIYSFGITTVNSSTQSFAAKESGSNGAQLVLDLDVTDKKAPTTPTGLSATVASYYEADLGWQASTDNVGVAGYTIYRDGTKLATVSGTTLSYADTSAQQSTTYTYTVDAFDQAGNHSSQSSPVSVTTPAAPSSVTYNVQADTYVNSDYPDANYGTATAWRVNNSTTIMKGYLSFNVQGLTGLSIQSVYLMVYANSSGSAGISALSVANNTWVENTITYNNAPPMGGVIGSSTSFAAGTWVSMDVTPYITGDGTYSFGITTPGTTQISFAAKESGSNAAYLVINLKAADTQAPSTPTGLSATAASYYEVDLEWQASTDNVGVAGYSIYRDGTKLATVSGTTLSYADTSAQQSTTYTYTVDAFDQAGNHSSQSSPVSVTTPAAPSSLTYNVQADTYVNSDYPDANYGTATTWRVNNSTTIMNGYLSFNVQGLTGLSIQNVYLMVYANSSGSAGINALSVTDNTWDESTITYNNAPAMGGVIGSSTSFAAGTWVSVDVTPYITGDGTYSFGITTPGTTQISFAAKESGSNAAYLVINLKTADTQAPSTPTGLSAAAASYYEVDLAWQASTDNVGVAGYTIYRDATQLATVSGTTLSYADTTAQPNTTYTYTVDAFDQAGNHSSQSSPSSATTPATTPTNLTFTVQADTYVNSSKPTSNYGSATIWRVNNSSKMTYNGYLSFNVQGLTGLSIQNVYLMVYANSSGSAGINVLSVADNTWNENTITYANAPPMGGVIGSSTSIVSGTWVSIDVTPYITGDGTYSFGVTTPGTNQISFSAKESGTNAAYLLVNLNN